MRDNSICDDPAMIHNLICILYKLHLVSFKTYEATLYNLYIGQ